MVSKIKQVLLSIAIALIFAFFVGFGISTFYKAPNYSDFCNNTDFKTYQTQEECIKNNGKWTSYDEEKPRINNQLICNKIEENNTNIILNCNLNELKKNDGRCDINHYCSQEYQNKRENYNRNIFIITTIIGLLTLIIGVILLKVESVGSGIMSGSILIMIYGTIRYWQLASDFLRFILLGIVLIVLIWIGYTKLNPKQRKTKK